jgi:Organic solute transporter Ostalpha
MFYGLTHEELQGRRPLAKFLSIKLIVMLTFYQSFIVSHICVLFSEGVNVICDPHFSSQHWRERLFIVRS